MDTEKQKSSPGGTVPGEKVPPVLMAEDVAALEELCGDVSGYFYKMLDYLDQRVRDGVRQGEFTEEQARGDLDLALWYAYACNNIDDYDYYYKAAQWMPASEPAAEAAGSGIWYYRYACALMYCGRLEEARHYAETGVSLDPEYPWGWLETAKLRAHFGDRDGALEAVRRGLELVPGDYEFTTLRREIQEGRSLEENLSLHFGMPSPEGYRKAQRLMLQAEKFRRPVITFIDTPGAYPGLEAEARGQAEAIARTLALSSRLTVPVVSVVTGEGGSGGALALGVGNRVLMLENAVYSVLSPEGFAAILWKDASRSDEACGVMKLTAADLLELEVADRIIPEPEGGAHTNPAALFRTLDTALVKELNALGKLSGPALAAGRYKKFRAMGAKALRKERT